MRRDTVVPSWQVAGFAVGAAVVVPAGPHIAAAVNGYALAVQVTGFQPAPAVAGVLDFAVYVGGAGAPTKLLWRGFLEARTSSGGAFIQYISPVFDLTVGGMNGGVPITAGDTYIWVQAIAGPAVLYTFDVCLKYQLP